MDRWAPAPCCLQWPQTTACDLFPLFSTSRFMFPGARETWPSPTPRQSHRQVLRFSAQNRGVTSMGTEGGGSLKRKTEFLLSR